MARITCVVDNSVRLGHRLWGEHGVSFYIEVGGSRVLFDTGSSGTVLLHNLEKLKINPPDISTVVLSHGHNDHIGGLAAFLEARPGVSLVAHPDVFRQRFTRNKERGYEPVCQKLTQEEVSRKARLRLTPDPTEVIPDLWTTGEITLRMEAEAKSQYNMVKEGDSLQPDPYKDDLSLVLKTKTGLVLICGCCHAGLLNTLAQVQRVFNEKIIAIVGGLHLAWASAPQNQRLAIALRDLYGAPRLCINHCTGEEAFVALRQVLGPLVTSCPAGTNLIFST